MNSFKEISIKKRTLLILFAVLVVLLGVGYFRTPKLMAASIENREQAGNKNAAMVLRERLIKFFPGSEEARWEVYSLADSLLQQEERVMIGPDFTSGTGSGGDSQSNPFTPEEVISYLQRVAEVQKEVMWKYNSYEKLAQLYKMLGNYEQAEENFFIAAQGFEKEKKDFRFAEVNVSIVDMYLETQEIEKALILIEESIQQCADQLRGEFLSQKGNAYFQLGDYAQAEQSYREALGQAEKDWQDFQAQISNKDSNINATLETQPVYCHSKSRLEQLTILKSERQGELGKVRGKIFSGAVPMPNVMVYLLNEQEYDGRANHLEEIAVLPPVKTNVRGDFEFNGVIPGKYFIVLGVIPEDLAGLGRFKGLEAFSVEAGKAVEQKFLFHPRVVISEPTGQQTFIPGQDLEIKWEEVPQASSYNLHLSLKLENGYVSRVYRQNLQGNSYLFNPQGLALREMNFVAWGDEHGLAPSAILGSFYTGAEIYFVVEALDDQGRSIADSEGYVLQPNGNYPSIIIKEKEDVVLPLGDKLVLEKNYPQALQAYLEELIEKPSNPQTLLSLARIYDYYDLIEGKANPPRGHKDLSDHNKALQYYGKLLEVTKEKFIVEEAASAAFQADNDKLAIELLEEIEDQFDEQSFWYHLMGELYFKTGQTDKALRYYLKYLKGQKEFRDLGPVLALLYQDDLSGAMKLLREKNYSQRARYNSAGKTEKPTDLKILLSNLEKYQQGTESILSREDFRKYLLEIVKISGSNRFEKVRAFQARLKGFGENDVLGLVLNELAKDRL